MTIRYDATDDPRLTAYVLGELSDGERQVIEQLLADSVEARVEVAAIRQLVAQLSMELRSTPSAVKSALAMTAGKRAIATLPSARRFKLSRRACQAALAATATGIVVVLVVLSPKESARIVRHGDAPRQFTSQKSLAAPSQTAPAHTTQNEATPAQARSKRKPDAKVQEGLVQLVDEYNNLMDQHRYREAEAVAARAEALAPNEPVTQQMKWEHRFVRNSLQVVDESSVPFDDRVAGATHAAPATPRTFPKNWEPLSKVRSPSAPAGNVGASATAGRSNYTIAKPVYENGTGASSNTAPDPATTNTSARRSAKGSDVDFGGFSFSVGVARDAPPNFADRDHRRSSQFDGQEVYAPITENDFLAPLKEPLSTFSIDVDTASYANVRRFLENGQLPPPEAVRIEELINYFRYDYAPPKDDKPLAVHIEAAACPWNTKHRLVRIGLKAREVNRQTRAAGNLVFLIDVSGSMSDENKLPLLKAGLAMLVEAMTETDRVAIVTYSDAAKLALEPTPGNQQSKIVQTISGLQAGGATNGAGGIQLAYETAQKHFRREGINRVILCTDGDFNVGVSDDDELVRLIQEKAKSGVFLSVFGFGMGNLKDAKLEKLADRGNGHYGYIDSRREARKAFVEDLTGTLVAVAKDVKLQVEFNPAHAGSYRLIGYENRVLAAADFNDDAKDAGELGAGHSVTALYEIVPVGVAGANGVDALKYQPTDESRAPRLPWQAYPPLPPLGKGGNDSVPPLGNGANSPELLTLKIRYKQPNADKSEKLEFPFTDKPAASAHPSADFDWAAAMAAFGMLLRDSKHKGQANWDLVRELAQGGKEKSGNGPRSECVELMRKAAGLRLSAASLSVAPGGQDR